MTTAIASDTASEMAALKSRLKATWMAGDYDRFSRYMQPDTELFFARLKFAPGTRLLDIACGAGQIALIAARAGLHATGCDIATNWLEKARIRAHSENLNVLFDEADAEALPYADGAFDAVVTVAGAMFAPRPHLVAAELSRVCRPGGVIAMLNWNASGFIGQMFRTISSYIAPSGMPSPVLWGDEPTVRERLRDGIARLELNRRMFRFDYPFPPDAVVEFFRMHYGPTQRAFASLDSAAQSDLRRELVDLWSRHNLSPNGSTTVLSEYLEVVAHREH